MKPSSASLPSVSRWASLPKFVRVLLIIVAGECVVNIATLVVLRAMGLL